jgi:hypothetical protein
VVDFGEVALWRGLSSYLGGLEHDGVCWRHGVCWKKGLLITKGDLLE